VVGRESFHPETQAAFGKLRHRTDDARRVLQELAQGEGFVAFSAGEALKRWEDGSWQLDPL